MIVFDGTNLTNASLTASDSETTLSTSLEVNESDGDGRFAVSSKTILEALKEIPEQPLTFLVNTENLEITVQYQNGKYSLMGQNADEYPQAPALRRKCGTRNDGRSGDAGWYQPFFIRYCR